MTAASGSVILGRMSHEPPNADEHPELIRRQSRMALVLFFIYLAGYAGFMGLSAFAPRMMAQPAVAGVNVAIIYGLKLIAGAVVLALVYMVLCHRIAQKFASEQHGK